MGTNQGWKGSIGWKGMRGLFIRGLLLLGILLLQMQGIKVFNQLPPRVEVLSKDLEIPREEALTPMDIRKLTGSPLAYQMEVLGEAEGERVRVIIANGNYGPWMEHSMVRGSFFTERASQLGLNVVVISKDLALRLFASSEVVKHTMILQGIPYQVVGVYEKHPLWTPFASDDREAIYIPVNSDFHREMAGDRGIQRLILPWKQEGLDEFIEQKVAGELLRISDAAVNYGVKDYTKAGHILRQFPRITGFLGAMGLILWLWGFLVKILGEKVRTIQEKIGFYTLQEIIAEDFNGYCTAFLLALIALLGTIILYQLAAFPLYLPSKHVPAGGLLRLDHYRQLVLKALESKAQYPGLSQSLYGRCYRFQLIFNTLCLSIEVILMGSIYRSLKGFLTPGKGEDETWQASA